MTASEPAPGGLAAGQPAVAPTARRGPVYRLVRTPPAPPRPVVLDDDQRRVVEHAGGPLLVLAGPGTGKTTTLVEAVARRVAAGADPDSILVLTFSRKAALELRERIAARLGAGGGAGNRGTGGPIAWTFHAWCYALLRAYRPPGASPGLRLLSGPEHDAVLRELVDGSRELGRPVWPEGLTNALRTRGFIEEIRALLARARELGLGPSGLAAAGHVAGRADWLALAEFYADYVDTLADQGAMDYSELVVAAAALAEDADACRDLRRRYRTVFVDEYQDTDPAQERLLRALAGDGGDLVAVGDPDQSIYAFRGAAVRGLLEFPHRFRQSDGRPAPVVALRNCRRMAPNMITATRKVAARIPVAGLPAAAVRAHRGLVAAGVTRPRTVAGSGTVGSGPVAGSGNAVEVFTYPSEGAEAEAVADLLRREHLDHHVPWDEMAVLTRGVEAAGVVARVLGAAGVPVARAADELPLAQDPAAGVLLLALRCAADPDRELTAETARQLLLSPLGGTDPVALRRLGRALRAIDREDVERSEADVPAEGESPADDADRASAADRDAPAADTGTGTGAAAAAGQPSLPASSAELIRRAVADPGPTLVWVDEDLARPVRRLGALLDRARARLRRGTAEDALWELWAGSAWPRRLTWASAAGGAAGRAADRDLDAIVALFATVSRYAQLHGPGVGVGPLVDELAREQVPDGADSGQPVGAGRGGFGQGGVALLTAHRSKGLEWDVVVVCHVQDGSWPDVRPRGSLLGTERLDVPERLDVLERLDVADRLDATRRLDVAGAGGWRPPVSRAELVAEERRLFYVATTRARRRLVVTAVESSDDDGVRPSQFLAELGVDPVAVTSRPARPMTLPSLVAALRRASVDPDASPALRQAALSRLARLAAETDDAGHLLVPAASPRRWWGLVDLTSSDWPVVPVTESIRLSGSSLSTIESCPLRWFLEHEANAAAATTTAQGFGKVVHALADEVTRGRTPAELAALDARLEMVWRHLDYESRWRSDQQRVEARDALARFLLWHEADRGRRPVASEVRFTASLDVGDRKVLLRGFVDRIELDADGRVHIVDFKTGKMAPSAREVASHVQLGTYQLAVRSGALDDAVARAVSPGQAASGPGRDGAGPGQARPGGAELVQLRRDDGPASAAARAPGEPPRPPQVQRQPALPADGPTWLDELLVTAVGRISTESFPPTPGDGCTVCTFRRCCPAQDEGRQVIM